MKSHRGCIWPTQVTTRTRVLSPPTLEIIKYPSLVHSQQIVYMIICKHNDTKNYETFGTNLRALQLHHKIESLEDKLEMIHKSSNHEMLKFFGALFVSSCSHLLYCNFFAAVTMPPHCANECGKWSSTKNFSQLKIAKTNCVEIGNAHSQHTQIKQFVFIFFWNDVYVMSILNTLNATMGWKDSRFRMCHLYGTFEVRTQNHFHCTCHGRVSICYCENLMTHALDCCMFKRIFVQRIVCNVAQHTKSNNNKVSC